MTIALTSFALLDDEIMPREFTCDGDNVVKKQIVVAGRR